MELFRFKRDIPFMKYGKLTTFISLATFVLAVFFSGNKRPELFGGIHRRHGYGSRIRASRGSR